MKYLKAITGQLLIRCSKDIIASKSEYSAMKRIRRNSELKNIDSSEGIEIQKTEKMIQLKK